MLDSAKKWEVFTTEDQVCPHKVNADSWLVNPDSAFVEFIYDGSIVAAFPGNRVIAILLKEKTGVTIAVGD